MDRLLSFLEGAVSAKEDSVLLNIKADVVCIISFVCDNDFHHKVRKRNKFGRKCLHLSVFGSSRIFFLSFSFSHFLSLSPFLHFPFSPYLSSHSHSPATGAVWRPGYQAAASLVEARQRAAAEQQPRPPCAADCCCRCRQVGVCVMCA